jgi:hypothetical protein
MCKFWRERFHATLNRVCERARCALHLACMRYFEIEAINSKTLPVRGAVNVEMASGVSLAVAIAVASPS